MDHDSMTRYSNLTDEELNAAIWKQAPQALKDEIAGHRGRGDDREVLEILTHKLKDAIPEEVCRELGKRAFKREVEKALTSAQPITKLFESVPLGLRHLRLPALCCISPFETERGKRYFYDWSDAKFSHIEAQLDLLEKSRSWKLRNNVRTLAAAVAPIMRDAPEMTLAEALKATA
jgi:hypothetical protein